MARLSLRMWLSLFAMVGAVRCADAQYRGVAPAEPHVAEFQARYAPSTTVPSTPAPAATKNGVQQAAFVSADGPPAGPTLPAPPEGGSIYPTSQSATEVIIPPAGDAWCMPPQESARTSSWTAAIELIPSITRVTDGQFGRWTDDGTLAARLILGYEDPDGIGVRARFWALSQEVETSADDLELNMGRFDLDLYKRVFLDQGELVFGAGPSSGSLEFELSDGTHSKFEGAGGSVFFDGYYPLLGTDKSQLGGVARGRYSILLGDWRDTTGGIIVPRTDNDTLTIAELAWGLEYRRLCGRCQDHSWFLGVLAEYQHWQSDWMSSFAGTSLGVSGVNVYTGFNW